VKSDVGLPTTTSRHPVDSRTFHVRDCICRITAGYLGRKCTFPDHVLSFHRSERPPRRRPLQGRCAGDLDRAGRGWFTRSAMSPKGSATSATAAVLLRRPARDHRPGHRELVAYANYYAVIDPDECLGCGACTSAARCTPFLRRRRAVVDRVQLHRCGLCVTGCPNGAASLRPKPASEMASPTNFAAGSMSAW